MANPNRLSKVLGLLRMRAPRSTRLLASLFTMMPRIRPQLKKTGSVDNMLQLSCRWRRIRCGPAEYFTHPSIPLKFRYLLPTFLLFVNSYCTAGSAHVPKRLNQRELEQLVRCMQRTELNRKQFGPVLRFHYKVVATGDQDADFDVNVVAYHRGSEKTGLLVNYGVIRRRC